MLAVLLFLAVICSFSFFAAFRLNRTFEETMPLSAMGIILVLFVAGLLNILGAGWIIVCILSVGIYGYTAYTLIKERDKSTYIASLTNLFTPGFFVFVALAVLIAYFNQDRLAIHTDEFSHWLDIVVIMTNRNAFGTVQGSGAIFPSYPPAMSLFQYLLEKINMVVTGDFSEWKVYFAYQLLAIIIMLPFINSKEKTLVQKIVTIITWPACLFLPLLFFKDVYSSIYIDPFLGVLGGSGFAAVSLTKKKDWVYTVYMGMLTAILVLSKDVGIYLAAFVGLYYLIDYIYRNGTNKKNILMAALPIISMAAAKLLWKLELAVSHTPQKFSQPFDISGTIDTLKGNGSEFYTTVYTNFKNALTYRYVYYERLGFNYAAIMTLLVIAFLCLHASLSNKGQLKRPVAISGAVLPSVAIIFYILSMFPLYISRFEEVEALGLASFDRYCGIMLLTGILLMYFLLRDMLIDMDGRAIPVILSVAMLFSVYHSQKDSIYYYTSRQSVDESIAMRMKVNILAAKINEVCDANSNVLVLLSDGEDLYRAILSTIAKPRNFDSSDGYFPSSVPEDVNSLIKSEELISIIKGEYDYVVTYSLNETLLSQYSDVFVDRTQIIDCGVYEYDNQTGKLTLIE